MGLRAHSALRQLQRKRGEQGEGCSAPGLYLILNPPSFSLSPSLLKSPSCYLGAFKEVISEPADAVVHSLKQMNSIAEGALLTGSASAGSQSLLASKADLQSLGNAAEIFALTTPKECMVLWEKDVLGQVCFV